MGWESKRRVKCATNLANDGQKGERDANGDDPMFDRVVVGVFRERLDNALHRVLPSRLAQMRGAREEYAPAARLAARKWSTNLRV